MNGASQNRKGSEMSELYRGAFVPSDGALDNLTMEIRNLCEEKGWRKLEGDKLVFPGNGPRTGPWFAAYCALATSEVSEALDAYRDKIWSDEREDGKPLGVEAELADALIRILDMADIWGIDIWKVVERVLAFGWTRPYQHGGRIL